MNSSDKKKYNSNEQYSSEMNIKNSEQAEILPGGINIP